MEKIIKKYAEKIVCFIRNGFKLISSLSMAKKGFAIFFLFTIFVGMATYLTNTSYAAVTDWKGFTTDDTTYNDYLGFTSGYFYLHMKKGNSICSNRVNITPVGNTGYNALLTSGKKFTFTNNNNSTNRCTSDYKVTVGSSDTQEYQNWLWNTEFGCNDIANVCYNDPDASSATRYQYVKPTVSITIPKGYRFDNEENWYGYDCRLYNDKALVLGFRTGQSIGAPFLLDNAERELPSNSSKTISGSMDINIRATGLITLKRKEGNYCSDIPALRSDLYYRTHQSRGIYLIPNETTITYLAGGGTGTMSNSKVKYDTETTLKANSFTKTGYSFNGWKETSRTRRYDSNVTSPGILYSNSQVVTTNWPDASKSTLTAQWTPNTYTIGYTLNGGTEGTHGPTSGTYDRDIVIDNPTKTITISGNANGTGATIGTPTSSTQTFRGWTSTTLGSNAKTGTGANPSTSWTGTFTKNTYFKNLKESGTAIMVANWTPVAVTLPTISKTGYTCKWYTQATGGSEMGSGGTSWTPGANQNSAVTAYARCTPNVTIVTYNTNTGRSESMPSTTHIYDTYSKLRKNAFTKKGYDFKEWATNSDGTGSTFQDEAVATTLFPDGGNVTLYAQWVPSLTQNLSFIKTDETTRKPIGGVKFNLNGYSYINNVCVDMTVTSDLTGKVTFKNVPRGKYKLTEISTTKYHILNNDEMIATIGAEDPNSLQYRACP